MKEKKIVLITGGLGDIGLATAIHFSSYGYRIAICDLLTADEACQAINLLKENGCEDFSYHKVDVSDEEEVSKWFMEIEEHWGVPQVIIPNAGIVVSGRLTDDVIGTSDVRKQMDINFWGAYHVAVFGAKRLKMQNLPGRIVFIGSWVADRPLPRISPYVISKAAMRMLGKSLAMELAEDNILVNEVAPGIVSGGLSKANQQKDSSLYEKQIAAIPVSKLISIQEVVQEIWRLSDFKITSVTGTVSVLDGGLLLTSKMT